MDKSEYFLTNSAQVNGIKVSRGDILRENATNKTVKVLSVYGNKEGDRLLMVEYNGPNMSGVPFQKGPDAFSFLS
jgi:hypothetical protein